MSHILETDYAVVNEETSVVDNIIVLKKESRYKPAAGYFLVDITRDTGMAYVGMKYENSKFEQPTLHIYMFEHENESDDFAVMTTREPHYYDTGYRVTIADMMLNVYQEGSFNFVYMPFPDGTYDIISVQNEYTFTIGLGGITLPICKYYEKGTCDVTIQ